MDSAAPEEEAEARTRKHAHKHAHKHARTRTHPVSATERRYRRRHQVLAKQFKGAIRPTSHMQLIGTLQSCCENYATALTKNSGRNSMMRSSCCCWYIGSACAKV